MKILESDINYDMILYGGRGVGFCAAVVCACNEVNSYYRKILYARRYTDSVRKRFH